MTIDLQSMKRLAELLAVDVLDQIEKDGGVNRVNLAEQLLAGLLLEAANKPRVIPYPGYDPVTGLCPACTERQQEIGGLHGLIAESVTIEPGKVSVTGGRYLANFDAAGGGAVHLVCQCDECKRATAGVKIVPHALDAAIAEKSSAGQRRVVDGVAWNIGDTHVFCECPECKRRRKLSLCGCEMCMHHTEAAALVWQSKNPHWRPQAPQYPGTRVDTIKDDAGEITTLRRDGLVIWYRGDIKRV